MVTLIIIAFCLLFLKDHCKGLVDFTLILQKSPILAIFLNDPLYTWNIFVVKIPDLSAGISFEYFCKIDFN